MDNPIPPPFAGQRPAATQNFLPDCFCPDSHLDFWSEAQRFMSTRHFNGHSMVGMLERVMVCSPQNAGWDEPGNVSHWRELGFLQAQDFLAAQAQHEAMCRSEERRVGKECRSRWWP